MSGSPLWAFFDEDDYDEDSDAEVDCYFDNSDDIVDEVDEWGNEIESIDGFQYIDADKIVSAEKKFKKRLRFIAAVGKPSKNKKQKSYPHLNGCRTETHLYEDRNKF